MLRFLPFEPWHLKALELAPGQEAVRDLLDRPGFGAGLAAGVAQTAIDLQEGDLEGSRVAACAGFLLPWPGRAVAWSLFGIVAAGEWAPIYRRCARMIRSAERAGLRRIEAQADAGFRPACRFLEALGFTPEGLMRAWSPDGRDHWLYARVR